MMEIDPEGYLQKTKIHDLNMSVMELTVEMCRVSPNKRIELKDVYNSKLL